MASEHYVGCLRRRGELDAFVSHGAKVYLLKQPLALSQEHRRNSDVQLVNEARTKILPYRVWPTADAYVSARGCLACTVERLVNAA